jgi:glycosyltransferase involved in cell wall biosynthesis
MTKIAFFLPSLAGGGAERVCVNLASGFLERGIEVDFVLAKAEGSLLKLVPSGVQVVDLRARRTLSAVLPLASYLRNKKPYALIAAPDHANLVAIWAKILSGADSRLIITTHNYLSIVTRETGKIQEKLYPILLMLFERYASRIVAVSKGVAEDLTKTAHIPHERISVIYNPAVRPEIARLASQTPNYPWLENDVPFLLAVGRLSPQKDYPTLLAAFARLLGIRQARLLILGEGEERQRLEKQISTLGLSGQVFFPGFTPNPYAFMSRCSVFVLSSAWEGFSVVVAEALSCGAQVVSTDCRSGPAEILDGGRYGQLVPVGDVNALADAIERAFVHPLPSNELKDRAMVFSEERAVTGYLNLIGLT